MTARPTPPPTCTTLSRKVITDGFDENRSRVTLRLEEQMPIAQIMFHKLIQDSQDYGSNDEHMVSRVFFDMKIEDKVYTDYANIKQPIGSNYEATPLEISKPIN